MREQRYEFGEELQALLFGQHASKASNVVLYNSVHLMHRKFVAPFIEYTALPKLPARAPEVAPQQKGPSDNKGMIKVILETNMMEQLA